MSRPSQAPVPPLRTSGNPLRAFSLVEVALALGVVGFAMLSILGLMQVGIVSLKESVNDSMTGLILNDVRTRINGTQFPSDADLAGGTRTTLQPYFYDRSGQPMEADASGKVAEASYRVSVTLGAREPALPDARVAVAFVTISWPLDPVTGIPLKSGHQQALSFLVTPATDRGWSAPDLSYQPRINQ